MQESSVLSTLALLLCGHAGRPSALSPAITTSHPPSASTPQTYADQRPRIKGRFVSPEEFAAWKEQEAEAGAGGGQGEEPADAQAEAAPRFQPVVMPAV